MKLFLLTDVGGSINIKVPRAYYDIKTITAIVYIVYVMNGRV